LSADSFLSFFANHLAMSLFGDSPTNSPIPKSKVAASLFDDAPASRNSGSLFADDNANSDSPWGFATTKRAARGTLIKTLLPADEVPESYIEVFDQLASEEGSHNTISPAAVAKILSESDVDEDSKTHILSIVAPDESKELSRGETNVLLALIGLVQEGEDATLDGVDDRRRSEYTICKKHNINSCRFADTQAGVSHCCQKGRARTRARTRISVRAYNSHSRNQQSKVGASRICI
jgi:hypothetical protein